MLESPAAVLDAVAISRAGTRLAGLAFGGEDYCGAARHAPRTRRRSTGPRRRSRSRRARAAWPRFGLPGPVAEIADMDGYERLLERAKAMGFTGTLCIHPKQVAVSNRVYTPTSEEIALATEIVAAFEIAVKEGRGAFALHGRMIDAPVADQARATLARVRGG